MKSKIENRILENENLNDCELSVEDNIEQVEINLIDLTNVPPALIVILNDSIKKKFSFNSYFKEIKFDLKSPPPEILSFF